MRLGCVKPLEHMGKMAARLRHIWKALERLRQLLIGRAPREQHRIRKRSSKLREGFLRQLAIIVNDKPHRLFTASEQRLEARNRKPQMRLAGESMYEHVRTFKLLCA